MIAKLTAWLGLDSKNFQQGVDGAKAKAGQLEQRLGGAKRNVTSFAGAMNAAATAAGQSVPQLTAAGAALSQIIETAKSGGKVQAVGVGIAAVGALIYAAMESGRRKAAEMKAAMLELRESLAKTFEGADVKADIDRIFDTNDIQSAIEKLKRDAGGFRQLADQARAAAEEWQRKVETPGMSRKDADVAIGVAKRYAEQWQRLTALAEQYGKAANDAEDEQRKTAVDADKAYAEAARKRAEAVEQLREQNALAQQEVLTGQARLAQLDQQIEKLREYYEFATDSAGAGDEDIKKAQEYNRLLGERRNLAADLAKKSDDRAAQAGEVQLQFQDEVRQAMADKSTGSRFRVSGIQASGGSLGPASAARIGALRNAERTAQLGEAIRKATDRMAKALEKLANEEG